MATVYIDLPFSFATIELWNAKLTETQYLESSLLK